MKCHKCGKDATPLKDFCESQGGSYVVMWWCYDCECEPVKQSKTKKLRSVLAKDVKT